MLYTYILIAIQATKHNKTEDTIVHSEEGRVVIILVYDNSGIEQYKNRGSFLLLFSWLLRLDCCGSKGARSKQKKMGKKAPKTNSCFMVPVGRSVGCAGFPSGE